MLRSSPRPKASTEWRKLAVTAFITLLFGYTLGTHLAALSGAHLDGVTLVKCQELGLTAPPTESQQSTKPPLTPVRAPAARPKPRYRKAGIVHVSKTGGTSAEQELIPVMSKKGLVVYGRERTFDELTKWSTLRFGTFRDPLAHVLSQFVHCRYDPYHRHHKDINWLRSFPRKGGKGPEADFENLGTWIDRFQDANWPPPGANWTWNCYNPRNMQTRFFGTECNGAGEEECTNPSDSVLVTGNLSVAIQNVFQLDGVIVLEFYHESLCIIKFDLYGKLPNQCRAVTQRENLGGHKHVSHGLPHYSVSQIPTDVVSKIRRITQDDAILYSMVRTRLVNRVREVELEVGYRIFRDPSLSSFPDV